MNTAILLFEGVEVLDFAGPFEVFSRTRLAPGLESRRQGEGPLRPFTVARTRDPVVATGGLRVLPDATFDDAGPIELLLIPGGLGTRPLLEDATTLEWIRRTAAGAKLVCSVCTGSLLLAKVGLLSGRRCTTHWGAHDTLAALDPSPEVRREERFVHDGVFISAGVAAGIDMAFAVVEHLFGAEVADDTARYIEYPRGGPRGA